MRSPIFSVSSVYVYYQNFNSPYYVNNDKFDIQFASTIAVVDNDMYIVRYLLTLWQHPWA